MADNFANSRFAQLPNEILLNILSRLDFASVHAFCEVYNLGYFLHEHRLVNTLDLQRQYMCNYQTLGQRIGCDFVSVLNINNVYWVPGSVLRQFIGLLKNLRRLYAMGTGLSIEDEDLALYNYLQLEVLGITFKHRHGGDGIAPVPTVRSLYLQMFAEFDIRGVFPAFEKIWIDCERRKYSNYRAADIVSVPKFVLQAKGFSPWGRPEHTYYENANSVEFMFGVHPYSMSCKDVFPLRNYQQDIVDPKWRPYNNLIYPLPCGPRDFWNLHHDDTLDTIRFYELCLTHKKKFCIDRMIIAYRKLLGWTCSSEVKRLHSVSCYVADHAPKLQNTGSGPSNRRKSKKKKKKVEIPPIEFNIIASHLQYLELFELEICERHIHQVTLILTSLQTFRYIKHLNLEVPTNFPDGFLVETFKKCLFLEVLKVRPTSANTRINAEVCKALPYGHNLKDFFFENILIPVDKILDKLCGLRSNKIQRFALNCDQHKGLSIPFLTTFLSTNPQMVFLYFVINSIKPKVLTNVQSVLKEFQARRPGRIYSVSPNFEEKLVPFLHYNDILNNQTKTLKLQACDEFVNF